MIRRDVALAAGMTLFLLLFEYAAFHPPYVLYLVESSYAGALHGAVRLVGLVSLIGAQALWFWASFAAPRRWRVFYGLGFAFIVALEHGYVRGTGGFTTGWDLHIALAEHGRWLTMTPVFASALAIVPAVVYATALVLAGEPRAGGHLRRLSLAVGLTLVLHAGYTAMMYQRGSEETGAHIELSAPTISPQAFARAVTQLTFDASSRALFQASHRGREAVGFRAATSPTRHIVLIVDESIRADHLSVNGYERPTTPWLDALQRSGGVTNWGVASSATQTSNDSELSMLTGVSELPDRGRRSLVQPSIFQFAKAMNYRTHLFDGSERVLRFGFDTDDLQYIDDWGNRDRFGHDVDTDFRIAREIARLLHDPAGQFIVVFKRGNHSPYGLNYPPDYGPWTPDDHHQSASASYEEDVVNTYDDAVRYNVDAFLQILYGGGGQSPSRLSARSFCTRRTMGRFWRTSAARTCRARRCGGKWLCRC